MKIKKVYLGTKQIYPEKEPWEPGTNTYAYYPLTTDAKDASGNNRNISTSWASSYGSDGAVLPNSNHSWLLIPFNINYSGTWTISFYVKWQALSGHTDSRIVDLYYTNNRIDCRIIDTNYWTNARKYQVCKNNSSLYTDSTVYTDNTWMYICFTINNWTVKSYRNWTQNASATVSWTTTYFRFWQEYNKGSDRHLYWNIKEIIVENRVRADQEVVDYYNQTKSLYGIN